MQLLRAWATLWLLLLSVVGGVQGQSSLCGEQLTRQTGFLNGLYYLFYESSSSASPEDIPVVLWLSGGPGCSGLVAALFEFGPCMFDDEANSMSRNPHSWTNIAHVIFVDQPHGTGFSAPVEQGGQWTERQAMDDLAGFVDAFFKKNSQLRGNDFFIFGESFGGHYVPDLAAHLLRKHKSWRGRLKGVGIGNGVVSPLANLQTYLDFAHDNKYAYDLLGAVEEELRRDQENAIQLTQRCHGVRVRGSPKRMRAVALESDPVDDDAEDEENPDCREATDATMSFESVALTAVVGAGHNMYDVRRPCQSDRLSLCYRFSRLEHYVNDPRVLDYLGMPGKQWSLCSQQVMETLRDVDMEEESEANVAFLLNHGVRVLVYVGDADAVAPWKMQERWTQDLNWRGSGTFRSATTDALTVDGTQAGTVRTGDGLTLVRVFDAGHMVPHDQPKVALELLRHFTLGGAQPVFS